MKSSIIITITLVAVSLTIGYFIGAFKPAIPENTTVTSNDLNVTLHVLIIGPDGNPMNGLEVDLWHDVTKTGPPDAGIAVTNSSGIAVFSVPKGGYLIGFNLINFPTGIETPREMPVSVSNDFNNATVNLHNKI